MARGDRRRPPIGDRTCRTGGDPPVNQFRIASRTKALAPPLGGVFSRDGDRVSGDKTPPGRAEKRAHFDTRGSVGAKSGEASLDIPGSRRNLLRRVVECFFVPSKKSAPRGRKLFFRVITLPVVSRSMADALDPRRIGPEVGRVM